MCMASLIHLSTLLLALSMTLAWSQPMMWLREIAWSVTADLFCSPVSDLLVLRVYALTSRGVVPTLPHLRQPVRPETERRTVIRQTISRKASVEAETSICLILKKNANIEVSVSKIPTSWCLTVCIIYWQTKRPSGSNSAQQLVSTEECWQTNQAEVS